MGWILWWLSAITFAFLLNDRLGEAQVEPGEFDFYWLALQLPASRSFSKQPCCYPPSGRPSAGLLIHGLWPSRFDGSDVHSCSREPFDENQLGSLRPEMERAWPSLVCPRHSRGARVASNSGFWRHEWKKHGTCSNMSLTAFFAATVNSWRKIQEADLIGALSANGITPKDQAGVEYRKGDILRAINDALERTFSMPPLENHDDEQAAWITCTFDGISRPLQLAEVRVCLDKESLRPMRCAAPGGSGSCPASLRYHTFAECTGPVRENGEGIRSGVLRLGLLAVGVWGAVARRAAWLVALPLSILVMDGFLSFGA